MMNDVEENGALLSAMSLLAKRRDEASRKSMYRLLLNATLYVPIEPDPEQPSGDRFAQDEPLHGQSVYAVFTSLDALARWRPESSAHTTMSGSELFPVLAESALGSCLINPQGDVRGELYRHEVQMLSEAVERLRAWREGASRG